MLLTNQMSKTVVHYEFTNFEVLYFKPKKNALVRTHFDFSKKRKSVHELTGHLR